MPNKAVPVSGQLFLCRTFLGLNHSVFNWKAVKFTFMKIGFLAYLLVALCALVCIMSCESRKNDEAKSPVPQVFTPVTPEDSQEIITDSLVQQDDTQAALPDTTAEAKAKREPMPTVAELKKITPSQEAKRALSNDAMQIYRMQSEVFFKFMQGRIPYYRGKGNLKTENDMLRIEITAKEMIIETPKGRKTFPMQ